jgi:hypothetical protein
MYVIPVVLGISLLTAALAAQLPQTNKFETFLRKQLGVSTYELNSIEKGQIVVKLPKTSETREVAVFAVMRLDVPAEFFINRVRDITTFKNSDNVLQIGKFSNPPRIEDLAGLTVDAADIDAIKRCRVNSCDLKMSAGMIERFRKEINWSTPNYRERAANLTRDILLEHVRLYLKGGNSALGEYNDKSYPVKLSEEFRSLLQPAPYMYEYLPEFQNHLETFPNASDVKVEDFMYWSKEKFGMKPVISLTHLTIYKRPRPDGMDVLIASKGIYATHYFEASLGVTGFIQSPTGHASRSYLMYVNRSRADALRGLFAGFKRSLISGSVRDGTKKSMEFIRQKLERDMPK